MLGIPTHFLLCFVKTRTTICFMVHGKSNTLPQILLVEGVNPIDQVIAEGS